jgi:hypothetical protein
MFEWLKLKTVDPAIGSMWVFKSQHNPFDEIKRYKVLALKDGWVRVEHIQTGKLYDFGILEFYSYFKPEAVAVK